MHISRRLLAINLVCLLALAACAAPAPQAAPADLAEPQASVDLEEPQIQFTLEQRCAELGLAFPPPNPRVAIYKAERRLELWSGATLVKQYPVALGREPVADKQIQGDFATPEGEFYICTRNPNSQFHIFLGLSYPNAEDARRGAAAGIVSAAERRQIEDAIRGRRQPPWNTRLGGAVGIHGGGTGMDWTFGCIALSDADIEELAAAVRMGTPVDILP